MGCRAACEARENIMLAVQGERVSGVTGKEELVSCLGIRSER